MTCRTVPMSPSLCTCGVVLDITVFHGDDDIGNDLCPTCSGCGCEPNERKNMTPDQIKALPVGSVVLDHRGCAWQKHPDGGWVARFDDHTTGALADDERLVLIHDPSAAPEPDHSMCARLVPNDDCAYGSDLRWALQSPSGEVLTQFRATDGGARRLGYAIPEPEPTVVERAAKVLSQLLKSENDESPFGSAAAQALADAGLLKEDSHG